MGWVLKPQQAKHAEPNPLLVGMELNATQARAVAGPVQGVPSVLPLDGQQEELPMLVSLEGRKLQVGRAGKSLSRQSPHLACFDFLAALGENRQWHAGRHRLDAARALSLVFERLQQSCAKSHGILLVLPAYVTHAQAMLIAPLAHKAKLPLLGSMRSPLSHALAAHASDPWSGLALIVDVDEHALSLSTVLADGNQLWIHASQAWPALNIRIWKDRILDKVADYCIRQSRRDPRDCAPAEQALYEQLDEALELCSQNRLIGLQIQTTSWYHHLHVRPEEFVAFCERMCLQVLEGVRGLVGSSGTRESLQRILLSRTASRLPGLLPALDQYVREWAPVATVAEESTADFGEDLIPSSAGPALCTVLDSDAATRAAHDFAARIWENEFPRGHFDQAVPLPSHPAPSASNNPKRTFRILSADS